MYAILTHTSIPPSTQNILTTPVPVPVPLPPYIHFSSQPQNHIFHQNRSSYGIRRCGIFSAIIYAL